MSRAVIGIDPGLDGGICVNWECSISPIPIPTVKFGKGRLIDAIDMRNLIQSNKDALFVLEEASKHSPGVLALCSTWYTFGSIETILKLNRVSYEIVRPLKWQRHFWAKPKMAKGQKFDTKAAAFQAAQKIWPRQDWTKSQRANKPHDGMIDAALISEYARRTLA